MFRRRNRQSQDSKASSNHLNDEGLDPTTLQSTLLESRQSRTNEAVSFKPDISMRRRQLPTDSLVNGTHPKRRGRSSSEPPQPMHTVPEGAPSKLSKRSTDGQYDRRNANPSAEDSASEDNHRSWFSRLGFNKKGGASPQPPRATRARKKTHTNVLYDETTLPYSNLRASRRELQDPDRHIPRIKGVAFRGTEAAHYLVILARSTGELLGATFVLATVFALFMLGVDTDQSGNVKDASFFDCFTALVSLLLTGTDDWAPAKLELDAGTYIIIAACYVIGSMIRLGFLGVFISRIAVRPRHILFSTWMAIHDQGSVYSKPCLEFRIGHVKAFKEPILQGHVQVTVGLSRFSHDGTKRRHFKKINLITTDMAKVPPFWTVTHPITEKSPFYNATWSQLDTQDLELTVLFSGIDSETMQPLYHCHTYSASRLVFQASFENMVQYETDRNRRTAIDFRKFNKVNVAYPVNRF
eukprot:m.61449 g.61449  ORF g.61449 m.61449 type:complete len:468 (-) comp13879_c0_seq1:34-1437(-)